MTVRFYSTNTAPHKIEDVLYSMTDGSNHVIAVEIFDSPQSRHSDQHDGTIGPWVVGDEAEVYEYIKEHGFEEYSAQYGVGGGDDD